MSTYKFMQDSLLFDFFTKSDKITIFKDGEPTTFEQNSKQYDKILGTFQDTIFNAYEMPAFGVSLHDETIEALKSGLWLEFHFAEEQEHNGMNFSSILINVSPEDMGFNLIRQYEGRYEGRCYYLNLIDHNMSEVYNTIIEVMQK